MRKSFLLIVLLFLLAACTSAPTSTQTQPAAAESPVQPSPTSTEYTSGSLWLRLSSPQDGDVVAQPVINVTGQAPAETVISLNDDILVVPADGNFSIPVTLDEGPNVLELVASNIDGDEIDLVLTVVYEK